MSRKRHQRAPQRRRPRVAPAAPEAASEEQDLIQDLRRAIRSDQPLDLLVFVSSLLTATDPRGRDPITADESGATREGLIESFIGIRYAETTAALTVLRSLVADDLTRQRITRELTTRRHPLPLWLSGIEDAEIDPRVFEATHILMDGASYFVSVDLAAGHTVSAVLYIDTNMGVVVKDAFMSPAAMDDLLDEFGSRMFDVDQSLEPIDPSDGRAIVEAAIEKGALAWPPIETDTWPMCRPLVEWMLRKLPDGGRAGNDVEWSDEQISEIADDFFASSFGRRLDGEDERGLMGSLLWFATSYTGGDPYRWSRHRVEVLLEDWFPRKVAAPTSSLAKLPNLLRAYVRYCHDRLGIRAHLTADTVEAIREFEPGYQKAIRTPPDPDHTAARDL